MPLYPETAGRWSFVRGRSRHASLTSNHVAGSSVPEGRATSELEDPFRGPVFIVGMPRSGTKVVRDLLRGHPRVRIPPTETNMLPRWVQRWDRFGDLSDRRQFDEFYRRAIREAYFLLMEKHTGGPLSADAWFAGCRTFRPEDVFEVLVRHDVGAERGTDLIWGDKSPAYTEHVDLLGRLFPQARVIHVVRDVRDYCLSLRKTWNKNMIRGAQRWADGVVKARRDGERLGDRYMEVRYEDLLAQPEAELRRCCSFLGLAFDRSLLELRFSTEHLGDAQGARTIVSTNARKYEQMLEPGMRARIEAIAGSALREFGYGVEQSGPTQRVSGPLMAFYYLVDATNFLVAHVRRSGLARAAQFQRARRLRV
jgi:sulfotransferase family protein